MTSTLGSARDTPWHGQVKFVPSMRKRFSLTPEPKDDTVLTVPLVGEVGDTPGAARMKSNMLYRRVGISLKYSTPKRVSNPLSLASVREPVSSTTMDSATPATFKTTVLSRVAAAPMRMSCP